MGFLTRYFDILPWLSWIGLALFVLFLVLLEYGVFDKKRLVTPLARANLYSYAAYVPLAAGIFARVVLRWDNLAIKLFNSSMRLSTRGVQALKGNRP